MDIDSTNAEILIEQEKAIQEFNSYNVCEGVSFMDNCDNFDIQIIGGKVLIVNPEKQTLTNSDICKLKNVKGLNYEQALVTKRESRSDINHNKKSNLRLYTAKEIIDKHHDRWLDTYETDRSGLHEVVCEKNLIVDNLTLDDCTNENMDITVYEHNLNLNSQNHEITKFYNSTDEKGSYKSLNRDLKLFVVDHNVGLNEMVLSTSTLSISGIKKTLINITSDIFRCESPSVIFTETTNFMIGTLDVCGILNRANTQLP